MAAWLAGMSAAAASAAGDFQALLARSLRCAASIGGPPMGRALFKQRRIGDESSARNVGNGGDGQGNQRAAAHDRSGDAQIRAMRAQQGCADEKRVHRVVPGERRPDSPAQHHEAGDDADQADFDAANVRRLLRIIAVQKSPEECGQDDGQKSRLRGAQQKRNREQAKEKFLARRGVDADRQRVDPRHIGADHVFVIEVLRRPRAQFAADDVKDGDVADVRGGEANADHVGAEKFLGANSGQAESDVQPDFIGLKDAIQRLSRHDGDHHEQRADDADQRGLPDLAEEKTGVRRVRVVSRAVQRPLIHRS